MDMATEFVMLCRRFAASTHTCSAATGMACKSAFDKRELAQKETFADKDVVLLTLLSHLQTEIANEGSEGTGLNNFPASCLSPGFLIFWMNFLGNGSEAREARNQKAKNAHLRLKPTGVNHWSPCCLFYLKTGTIYPLLPSQHPVCHHRMHIQHTDSKYTGLQELHPASYLKLLQILHNSNYKNHVLAELTSKQVPNKMAKRCAALRFVSSSRDSLSIYNAKESTANSIKETACCFSSAVN
nr:hypothetical protein Iba_chr11eCG14010 [Ipomoea batatas]